MLVTWNYHLVFDFLFTYLFSIKFLNYFISFSFIYRVCVLIISIYPYNLIVTANCIYAYTGPIRDRPFNLKGGGGMVFCFVQKFFFGQHKLEYFFLSREARNFFPEFNIRLYDKNSESDYFFFPPPKSEYFFQQHWESEYFFRKKT